MMAFGSPSKRLQSEVTCPICLDDFTDPVVLDCGHSFCQACVVRCWTFPGTEAACPQCRSAVRPDVRLNRLLANMGDIYWQAKDAKAKKRESGKRKKETCPIKPPWWSIEGSGSDVAPLLEQVMEEEPEGKPDQNLQAAQPSELGHGPFPIHKKNKNQERCLYYTRDNGIEGEGPSTLCNLNSSYDACRMKEDPNHDLNVEEGKAIIFPPLGSTSIPNSLVDLPGGSEGTILGAPHHPASSLGRILKELAEEPIQNSSKEEHLDAQHLLPDLHQLPFNRSPPRRTSTPASGLRDSENDLSRRRTSYVWKYFTHLNDSKLLVVCGICRSRVRLGKEGGCPRVGTSSMRKHIEYRHPQLVPKSDSKAASTLKGSRSARGATKTAEPLGGQRSLQNRVAPRKQRTIPETWGWKEKPARDSVKSAKLNQALAVFVARSMLPLSVVEDKAFLEFMEELEPSWEVPSRSLLCKDLFPALEKDIKRELLKDLQGAAARAVHLTGAIWTNKQTKAYLCVAAHWISTAGDAIERKSATLAVRLLSDLNQAPNVARELKSVVSEWLTPLTLDVGCITTNNGSGILKAVQQSGMEPVLCITHCLNLVLCRALKTAPPGVKDMLNLARNLSVHFRQSWAAAEAIRIIQRRRGLPEHRFLLDASTCWESTLQMLARLCEQKLAIEDYMEDQGDLLGFSVPAGHWSVLQDLVDLLKLFSEFAAIFKLERATFGKALPMLQFLEVSVARSGMEMAKKAGGTAQNQNPAIEFAHHLLGQLRSSKQLASIRRDKRYLAATFLEPQIRCSVRAKLVHAVDRQFSTLREYILQKCLHYHEKDSLFFPSGAGQGTFEAATQTEGPAFVKQENGNEWDQMDKAKSRYAKWLLDFGICTNDGGGDPAPAGDIQQQDAYGLVRRELDAYIRESFSGKVSCSENNPLLYWKAKTTTWPSLAKVALWHLSCPPSSMASKRVFSTARNVATKLRTSLTPKSVSTLAFIRANQSWIPKEGVPPPTNREANVTSDEYSGEDSEEEMTLLEEDTEGEEESNEI
ncbi:hypothetical protein JRQ81_012216 [Phrynocephalus forsythii]|uniref:Uncharacterized protein n=1 Tax=Phrynocephalus forsythii TaxID=171643 RepID=A0A9Q0X7C2_9SAUR|nr:hypothetical protein JRQ81_012216 [Phrynocephalus forsythii]